MHLRINVSAKDRLESVFFVNFSSNFVFCSFNVLSFSLYFIFYGIEIKWNHTKIIRLWLVFWMSGIWCTIWVTFWFTYTIDRLNNLHKNSYKKYGNGNGNFQLVYNQSNYSKIFAVQNMLMLQKSVKPMIKDEMITCFEVFWFTMLFGLGFF